MTAERWQQIESILQSALAIEPGAERESFVAASCAGDDELRLAVERLIEADGDADSFIESPAWSVGKRLFDSGLREKLKDSFGEHLSDGNEFSNSFRADYYIGKKIGVFEIVKELGRGGMGAVYLAKRADGEFRQQVAVKLIKRGLDTDFTVKRFIHERQILAALDHPFIAGIIDGGTNPDGSPYFVMEYVEGKSLYRFCDEHKLGTIERLKLFANICEAVEAAHRIKVVHRDLKPSNILVKVDGTPKLLDFGIAKILDPELAPATLEPTATAVRMMTPEYASPEQVRGEPVSPASDIYSLGVLLYELMTGHRPYRLKNRALHEIHRAVCEETPKAPSECLEDTANVVPSADAEIENKKDENLSAIESVFRSHTTNFEVLKRELAGDLDKIILKALRKNPEQRYQTAAALAADINRYLAKRPVEAEHFSPEIDNFDNAPARVIIDEKVSIAILPFKLFGVNAGDGLRNTDSDEFLGIGLADALVTRLSGVPRLIVRPTSSVLSFGDSADPFAAGQKLSVKFVCDGNVRRSGERIRVSVQLLNLKTNATVWAQTFDEQFTDVLAVEDSISERVVTSLVPKLTGEENERLHKRGTNSPEAYEAYLRGRFHWNQFTPEALAKAIESFRTAIRIDPDYALAHVGVADFYSWANVYGLIPSAAALNEAERAARRAIEIDDRLGEAYASLGIVVHNRMRWAEGDRLKHKAMELNPNYSIAHECWAAQLVGFGEFDEGIREMRLAESLDPLSLRTKTLTAWTLYQAHRYDEALATARQIVELDKNYPQGFSQIGFALWAMKRYDEALTNFQKFSAMIPDSALPKYQLCFGLAAMERRAEARAVLEEIEILASQSYVKPFFRAMAHVAVGDQNRAFEYFERSFEEQEPWLLWFGTDPMLECLHDDARYANLLDRMDNPLAARFKNRPMEKF